MSLFNPMLFALALLIMPNLQISAEDYSVTVNGLNVRSGPGVEYSIIGKLSKGERVKVIEGSNKTWYQIKYERSKGYVSSKYLTPTSMEDSNLDNGYERLIVLFGGLLAIFVLIGFLFKKSALITYGSIFTLIAATMYYVFGLLLNWLSISLFSSTIEASFLISFITYVLAGIVGVLSIIGFFRNVGIGVIVISVVIFTLDSLSGALPGVILSFLTLLGGIFIATGYSQINTSSKKASNDQNSF